MSLEEIKKEKPDEKIINSIIYSLEEEKEEYLNLFEKAIKQIKAAKTIDEVMRAKSTLLFDLIDTTSLGPDSCYFCIKYDILHEGTKCDKCEYGKEHGMCFIPGSAYDKILTDLNTLVSTITRYYWR